MLRQDYMDTIDTMYPDGYARESLFRSSGDMLTQQPVERRLWKRLWDGLRYWRMRRAGRLSLRDLTDHELADIGVTMRQPRPKPCAKLRLSRRSGTVGAGSAALAPGGPTFDVAGHPRGGRADISGPKA